MNLLREHFLAIKGTQTVVIDSVGSVVCMRDNRSGGNMTPDEFIGIWGMLSDYNRAVVIVDSKAHPIVTGRLEGMVWFKVEKRVVQKEFVHHTTKNKTRSIFNAACLLFPEVWPHGIHFARTLLMAELLRRIYTGEDYEVCHYQMPGLRRDGSYESQSLPRVPFQLLASRREGVLDGTTAR